MPNLSDDFDHCQEKRNVSENTAKRCFRRWKRSANQVGIRVCVKAQRGTCFSLGPEAGAASHAVLFGRPLQLGYLDPFQVVAQDGNVRLPLGFDNLRSGVGHCFYLETVVVPAEIQRVLRPVHRELGILPCM